MKPQENPAALGLDCQIKQIKQTGRKIPAVNGLRGVAATAVLFHHSAFVLLPTAVTALPLVANGWLGVNLFFILSGFVLYLPYAKNEPMIIGQFYRQRFWRLAPLFYFCALVSIALSGFALPNQWKFYTQSAALLSGLFTLSPHFFFPEPNILLWSLGVEFLFSLMFPLLVWAMRRNIGASLALIWSLSFLTRWCGFAAGQGSYIDWISASALGRMDEFFIGMLVAHFYTRGKILRAAPVVFCAGLGLLSLAMLGFDAWHLNKLPLPSAAALISVADVAFAVMIFSATATHSSAIHVRCLSSWPLQVIGLMCYSLYVWHLLLLNKWIPVFSGVGTMVYPFYLALLLAISAFTYRFIEFRRVSDWRSLFLLGGPRQERGA